ncbi:TMEM165/GDT1 family protein [Ferrimonas senticii]|uniref:TMEM165/GDT1 family protein n=1 Tax=Ferrimonas senticii TaxID=394566 RepID=UPI0004049EC6|nr:TMEM165/GDT1 family protein [Ferrimonas senticii]
MSFDWAFADPANSVGLSSAAVTFVMVALAEIGDKSQLVCMTLANRYRAKPVIIGAMLAFLLLNALAVIAGSLLANLLPIEWVSLLAALLFAWFGISSLRASAEEEDEVSLTRSSKSIALSAFMLLFLAELGDKTQLSVATLSATESVIGVWLGASAALLLTTVLAVVIGRKLLAKVNPVLMSKVSGALFLLISAVMLLRLWQ